MSGPRPGRGQVLVLHLEPKRAAQTVGYAFMTILALAAAAAALLYRTDVWPTEWRFHPEVPNRVPLTAAAVAVLIALLSLAAAVANGRRWHIARVVEGLSEDREMAHLFPHVEASSQPRRASIVPALDVSIVKARKLPKPHSKLRPLTPSRNVIGQRPLRIAYLRLFENQPRIRTFIQGAWREFGHVYLLRSAASVTPAEYRRAKNSGDIAGIFADSPHQILPALDSRAVHGKGRYRLKTVGPYTVKVRDKYGTYSVHAFLCHGAFWKAAVDMLLARVDLVVLDLSGFLPQNVGTHYELQRVVDRFPIEQVVFLADPSTDREFVTAQIESAWSEMAAGSPNAGPGRKEAMVVVTDLIARQTTQVQSAGAPGQAGHQAQTQVRVRLVARRRETRRVAAMAQARINEHVRIGNQFAPIDRARVQQAPGNEPGFGHS